jgi:hypothetical protein
MAISGGGMVRAVTTAALADTPAGQTIAGPHGK